MSWYGILTQPSREAVAAAAIAAQGHEVLFLHRMARRHRAGQSSFNVKAALFQRYLFAAPVNDGYDLRQIRRLHGVADIVPSLRSPIEIPLDVINALRARGDPDGLVVAPPMRIGDKYRIGRTSPLAGLLAEIASLPDPSGRLTAFVRMFGSARLVRLTVGEIEPEPAIK